MRYGARILLLVVGAGCGGAPGVVWSPGAAPSTGGEAPLDQLPPGERESILLDLGPPLTANTILYRDAGKHPATGRSGTATLEVRALLGRDAVTAVDLRANGSIVKAQIKALDQAGVVVSTHVFTGLSGALQTFELAELAAGQTVQAQANIREVDGARTDVVTVTGIVHLRPDLAIEDLAVPSSAYLREGVAISAVVRELNGDLGARADCVLSVDGTRADQALGIWVDAGGAVSCAFRHRFATEGPHLVAVGADNIDPADFDPANNQASRTIEIVRPRFLAYSARISDRRTLESSLTEGTWRYPTYQIDFKRVTSRDTHLESAMILAHRADVVEFPLASVAVLEVNQGAIVKSLAWDAVPATYSYSFVWGTIRSRDACGSRYVATENAYLNVCSSEYVDTARGIASRYLSIDYRRLAGDVVYHSTESGRTWSPTYAGSSYVWNSDSHTSYGRFTPVSTAYDFELTVKSGTAVFKASPAIRPAAVESHSVIPYRCLDYRYAGGVTLHQCGESRSDTTGRDGLASGAEE